MTSLASLYFGKTVPAPYYTVSCAWTQSQGCHSVSSLHSAALKHHWCTSATELCRIQKTANDPVLRSAPLASKGTHSNDTRHICCLFEEHPLPLFLVSARTVFSEFCNVKISHEMERDASSSSYLVSIWNLLDIHFGKTA